MEDENRKQVTQEYVQRMKKFLPIVKIGAYNKFDIENGQFVSLTRWSQIYAFIVISILNLTGYFILYETTIKTDILTPPEYMTIIELWIMNNLAIVNIHIFNKDSGAELIKNCIEMDLFLGVKQTKFMRDIAAKDVVVWSACILSFQLVLTLLLISTFYRLPIYTYFTGAIFFQLLMSFCYDQVLTVVLYTFLCLRVHYLNVGLVKIAKLNTEYLMDQLLLYPLFWKKEYNDYVDIPKGDTKYFTETLEMVVAQVRRAESCYRFVILLSTASLVIGTFLGVQIIIIFIKTQDMDVIRTYALTGWFVVSWSIFIVITVQTDKLYTHVRRTELICTYIQLKPNNSDEIFHLSKSILHTLSVSNYKISVYDMFYYDLGLLRSVATSVFVYITMQLQIAFPKVQETSDRPRLTTGTIT